MRKILIVVALLAIFPTSLALAEYGTWEKISSIPGQPGLSNAAFMSLGIGDADHLYTAGVEMTGATEITWAWDSSNGGVDWTPALQSSIGSGDCGMLNLFSFTLTAGAADADHAAFAGLRVNPDCIAQNPFPKCLFLCMFQLDPVFYYTTDAGKTVNIATVAGATMYEMAMAMHFVSPQMGYAAGIPGVLYRTQDGGQSWFPIISPGGKLVYYYDVQFLDENTGFLVSGIPEQTSRSTGDPLDRYNELRHIARYVKDPIYRLQWQETHPYSGSDKGQLGHAWRTDDGGATWTEMLKNPNYSFISISMVTSDVGFILAQPHTGSYPVALFKTADGGKTWSDITSRLPQSLPNIPKWMAESIAFEPGPGKIGLIAGAGMKGLSTYMPVLLYTADGGETWALDESVVALEDPILQVKWANPKLAFAVGFELATFRYTQKNVAPVADAGQGDTGVVGEKMTLDGSKSWDYDGDPLTYKWEKISGPAVVIADDAAAKATFTASAVGEAIFQLTVNDGQESDSATVAFTITEPGADDDQSPDDDASPDDDDDASPATHGNSATKSGCGC